MRILFDHCVPRPLRRHLPDHEIKTAFQMGWATLKNGKLLEAAEIDFDVLLTVDQNLTHQQNMQGRQIALVVLVAQDNKVTTLVPLVPALLRLLPSIQPGGIYHLGSTPAP